MKANIEITLKPFSVPNFVIIETPPVSRSGPVNFDVNSLPLAAIDASVLERMCEDFTQAVFKKAGVQRSPRMIDMDLGK